MAAEPREPARRDAEGRSLRRDTPFGHGIPLGRWAGIPVRAHWSALVTLVLFAAVIAGVYLPETEPGASVAGYVLAGVLTTLALFVTLLAHELAHAVTARHYGLGVRRITLWMLGGLTEIEGDSPTARADAAIAGAGPGASLAIGGLLSGAAVLLRGAGLVGDVVAWLALMNLALGIFNLLPGAPLDGGRLLRALLWWRTGERDEAAEAAARAGRVLGITLVALGLLGMLVGYLSGVWLALLGWFIVTGAASERYAARAEALHGLTARDAMTPTPRVVPSWWTCDALVSSLTPQTAKQPIFPLVDLDGRLTGIVTLADLDRVPLAHWPDTPVRDVEEHRVLLQVAPDADLADLLLPLHLRGGFGIVTDDGRPLGVVTEQDLARLAQLSRAGWSSGGRTTTQDREP